MWDIDIFEEPIHRMIFGLLIILIGFLAFIVKTMKTGQFEIDNLLIAFIIIIQGLPFIFTYKLYKDHYESINRRVLAKPVSYNGAKFNDHSKFYADAIRNEETDYSRVLKKWMIANVVIIIILLILSNIVSINAAANPITTNLQNNTTVTVVSSPSQAKYAIAGYGIVIFLAINILLAVLFTSKKYGVKTLSHKIIATVAFVAICIAYLLIISRYKYYLWIKFSFVSISIVITVLLVIIVWLPKRKSIAIFNSIFGRGVLKIKQTDKNTEPNYDITLESLNEEDM